MAPYYSNYYKKKNNYFLQLSERCGLQTILRTHLGYKYQEGSVWYQWYIDDKETGIGGNGGLMDYKYQVSSVCYDMYRMKYIEKSNV